MSKLICWFSWLLLSFALFGCVATWSGTLSSSLAIPIEKYHVVKVAQGHARTFVFLGILGGLGHDNLVAEAKMNLIRNNPLDSNQVFGDWSVSFKNLRYLFGIEQQCEVRANVISLVPPKKKLSALLNEEDIRLGDSSEVKNIAYSTAKPIVGDLVEFEIDGRRFYGKVVHVYSTVVQIEYRDPMLKALRKTKRFKRDVKVVVN